MTNDMLYDLGGVPVTGGETLLMAGGNIQYCDPTNGTAGGDGLTPTSACSSLLTCYNRTRDAHNDIVFLIGGATAWNPAATLAWSNTYTHLIGITPPKSVGQRARIEGLAATALTSLIDFSGNGCVVKNIQLFNDGAASNSTLSAATNITAARCYFENCFFAGMGGTLNGTYASGYSVKITGDENTFVNCALGTASIERLGANSEVWMTGQCNRTKFINCEFQCWSNVAGKRLILIDSSAVTYTTQFVSCLFENFKSNNGSAGTALNFAIGDAETPYHQILLRGDNLFVGVTKVCTPATYVFGDGAATGATYGIGINPTT